MRKISNFIKIYENSFKENWELPALTDYNDRESFTYEDMANQIARLHILFQHCHVRRGDKIALIGKNTPRWCIVHLAVMTYGAIIVPILQDFNPNDLHHIVNHSESVLLFTGDQIWESLEEETIPHLRGVLSLTDFSCLCQRDGETISTCIGNMNALFRKKYPKGLEPNEIKYADLDNEKVILINYTSGTTGFTKGVMLTGENLGGNVTCGVESKLHFRGSKCLSFLPLAHAYGCAFDFLVPMAVGTHVTLLGKIPSPKILLKAFEEIKPNLILSVPLVLEKIYKKQILPMLSKRSLKMALNIPLLDNTIYNQIRKKLTDSFGGRFEQIIIGGAPLNSEVEAFLYKIKFPFTVGYGMTECGPLISYEHYSKFVPGSAGKVLEEYIEARIDSTDPAHIPGEIWVRGTVVMKGYYKNESATKEAIDKEGWLHTGDIGTIDADNNVFIKGRSKTMILGPNGQNIYPEEIEAKLNNLPFIMESLVLEKEGKLIALVYPDYEAVDNYGISNDDLPVAMEEIRKKINSATAPYEHIAQIQLYPNEFEKTPKKSIKRYLYSSLTH